jgi:hypothetical protein
VLFFARAFATTFLAALLVSSGVAHAAAFPAFRATLESHGVVPAGVRTLVAVAVVSAELALGSLLIAAGWSGSDGLAALAFGGGALVGTAFLLYVRRLLRQPAAASTCGCSPLTAPVTLASLVPAASLTFVAGVGLAAVWVEADWLAAGGVSAATLFMDAARREMGTAAVALLTLLPIAWGMTCAGVVWLLPAAAPAVPLEEP